MCFIPACPYNTFHSSFFALESWPCTGPAGSIESSKSAADSSGRFRLAQRAPQKRECPIGAEISVVHPLAIVTVHALHGSVGRPFRPVLECHQGRPSAAQVRPLFGHKLRGTENPPRKQSGFVLRPMRSSNGQFPGGARASKSCNFFNAAAALSVL